MHTSVNKQIMRSTTQLLLNFEHDMKGRNIEFIDAKFESSHF